MAEAALLPYLLTVVSFGLFGYYLLTVWNSRRKERYFVKNPANLTTTIAALTACYLFIVFGLFFIENSKIFGEAYSIQEEFKPDYTVQFEESDPNVSWMGSYQIHKTVANDPLVTENSIGFRGHVLTKELPQELVIHIFHEDMIDFFTGSPDEDYRDISSKLNRIPAYNNYHNTFSIKFPLTESPSCNTMNECHYDLNAENLDVNFTKSGKYFAQISVKTADGIIDHQISRTSLFIIPQAIEIWSINSLEAIADEVEGQRALIYFSLGFTGLSGGIAAFLLFLPYAFNIFGKEKSDDKKPDDKNNLKEST